MKKHNLTSLSAPAIGYNKRIFCIDFSDKEIKTDKHKENLNLNPTAQRIYEYISAEPVHIDKISSDLGIPVFKVLSSITELEMKNLVTALQGRRYILK